MTSIARRFAAAVFAIAMFAADTSLCEGWSGTADTRMACCKDGSCPMHKKKIRPRSTRQITQADADACCAGEASRTPARTTHAFRTLSAHVLGHGVVRSDDVSARPFSVRATPAAPIPISPPPRHLLLSVFLI